MSSETITRADLAAILNEVLPSSGGMDYIVEQGTSGIWTYRKWNSGVLEQWAHTNPGGYTINTARGNMYSGGNLTYNYPIAFIGVPTVTCGATLTTDAYAIFAQEKGLAADSITVRICAGGTVASNNNYVIHIHAVGFWK